MRNLVLASGAIVLIVAVGAACGGGSGSKTATPGGSSTNSAFASSGTPSADVATQVSAASTVQALATLAGELTPLANGTVVTASGQAVPPAVATQAAAAATAVAGQVAAPTTPPGAQTTPCVFNNNAPGCATAPPESTAIAPGAQGIAIDSNPATPNLATSGVTAASGGTFSVGINIVTAPEPYQGYEWDLVIDGPVKFVSSTPDKPAGLTICSTPTNTTTANDWYAGCISTDKQITYTGRVDTAILQCTGSGTGQLRLKKQSEGGSFGTDLLNSQSQPITGDVGPAISVTCT